MKPSARRRGLAVAIKRVALVALCIAVVAFAYFAYRRFVAVNFAVVIEGSLYRSGQPSMDQLERWAGRYGFETVVNLRGARATRLYAEERTVSLLEGMDLIDIRWSARQHPPAQSVRQLIGVFENAAGPILIHCRDGVDRSGVASVLGAMALGDQDYDEARRQLCEFPGFRTDYGIYALLRRFEEHIAEHRIEEADWADFRKWALREYHPYYFRVEIEVPDKIRSTPGETVIVRVRVINRSRHTIPLADPTKRFTLAAFLGSSEFQVPDEELGSRSPLPRRDLAPAGSIDLEHLVRAPAAPGVYRVHFDLIEESRAWFGSQGSPVPDCELLISEDSSAAATAPPARARAE